MKQRLLQHGRLPAALEASLAEHYDVHPLWTETDPAAFLASHGGGFARADHAPRIGVDAAMIAAMPALKVISSFGVGLDKIDLEAARARHCSGLYPDVLNDCVADTAFGLLMDVARGFSAADRFVRRGEWPKAQFPLSTRVGGKRLGIIGMGRIGRVIARRGSGTDMEVRYNSRRPAPDAPYRHEPSLTELARWADFLVIATAGGPGDPASGLRRSARSARPRRLPDQYRARHRG
ncbi:NAD(P)-dependent oxidoreductase [Cupriavidus basilensis]